MIELEEVKLKYGNTKPLSLELQRGETWGILGPNGCGKTTLLLTIAHLFKPKSGNILLQQQHLSHLSIKTIAKHIGFLKQEPKFPSEQTVWEYCAAARFPHLPYWQRVSFEDKVVQEALIQMKLQNYRHRRINTLSGGEKKRVSIAALLAQTPTIYLLDEPTNHLDIHFQFHTLKLLRHIATQSVVIMSLHDVNLAQQYCDKILMLFANGNYIAGNKQSVLTSHNVSELYLHPMQCIEQGEKKFWLEL